MYRPRPDRNAGLSSVANRDGPDIPLAGMLEDRRIEQQAKHGGIKSIFLSEIQIPKMGRRSRCPVQHNPYDELIQKTCRTKQRHMQPFVLNRQKLLVIKAAPVKVSNSYALGVFLGTTPFVGLKVLSALHLTSQLVPSLFNGICFLLWSYSFDS